MSGIQTNNLPLSQAIDELIGNDRQSNTVRVKSDVIVRLVGAVVAEQIAAAGGMAVVGSVQAGLDATSDGAFFSVPEDDFLILYRNDNGEALEVARTPAVGVVEQARELAQGALVTAEAPPRKLALPNADFHLTGPAEIVVDRRLNIIQLTQRDGSVQSVRRHGVGWRAYPFRFFDDGYQRARVDIAGRVIPAAGASGSAFSTGPMHVDLHGESRDLLLSWQHGQDQMLRVHYMPNGFNDLFNWRATYIAPLGPPETAAWQLIHSSNSDCWPPLIVEAVNNGDGGSSIYTGGNHGSDGGSGGQQTARMTEITFWVDGRRLAAGESFRGHARCVTAAWTNELMAYNTITLARYVLEQRFRAEFRPGDVSGFCAVSAYEPIRISTDNGPQLFSQGYDTVHFYDGEQQGRIPIPEDGTTFTSGLFGTWPSWACVLGDGVHGYHGAWMDREFAAGDGRYIGGSAGAFRKGSSLKFYSNVVGGGGLRAELDAGGHYEWHGGYFWAPADAVDGLDSAFTFHRRGRSYLAHAFAAAGEGRIDLPSWAAGREVADLGVGGNKGLAVSATGYLAALNEIKE